YCMVHGRDRAAVLAVIERLAALGGLAQVPRETLFSRQRFKQTGPRRFRALPTPVTTTPEDADALSL
ncbi:MAG: Lrp/AsnC family transcriptional regulator, partial [Giesbergeria sp.]|nr:Lrp/AsnC family transcriptional regulator [Giesbergeria sp.]